MSRVTKNRLLNWQPFRGLSASAHRRPRTSVIGLRPRRKWFRFARQNDLTKPTNLIRLGRGANAVASSMHLGLRARTK
jgi:hypothetical protein